MGNQVVTATDFRDAFEKIVTFLTTNSELVTAGQQWVVLRRRVDNLAAVTLTSLTNSASVGARSAIQSMRYDPRSLNSDSPISSRGYFNSSSFSAGNSAVTMQLRVAKEVKTVRMRSLQAVTSLSDGVPRNMRLQYSDDGVSYTTAATIAGSSWGIGERRDYAVPGSPGAHIYWKVIIDSVTSGSSTAWESLLLLDAGGDVVNHFGDEVILKGVGNSGTDAIYVGMRSEYSSTDAWYNIFLNGYSGFSAAEDSWFNQPGALPGFAQSVVSTVPMMPMWDNPMPMWLSASGRSFRIAVKVGTSYEGAYLGLALPYATPAQHPYPLVVGGSLVPQSAARGAEWRYSYASYQHGVFPGPGGSAVPDVAGIDATLYFRNAAGNWGYHANRPNQGSPVADGIFGPTFSNNPPHGASQGYSSVWPHCMNDQWSSGKLPFRECQGGGYLMQPCILLQRAPSPIVFGELEGVYVVSGFNNAAENTTTYSGKTVVMFQNAYRTTAHEYWALSLD
jgi:hypothetical protein